MRPPLLDITRSLYRTTPQPTGIDRVQAAYETWAQRHRGWAVGRIGGGLAIMDPDSWAAFRADHTSALDVLARMQPWRELWRLRIEARLRRYAALARNLPDLGVDHIYINVGHSNLELLPRVRELRVAMLHDAIPLDLPAMQTPAAVARFRAGLAASRSADLLMAPSRASAEALHRHLPNRRIEVVSLGVPRLPEADPMPHPRPYVLVLGTIEPRKNHLVLFRAAERRNDLPDLVLIGRRGWNNGDAFRFLDRSPLMGNRIFELGARDDTETAGWLRGAAALAFPSRAEGFGLPLLEALQEGVPVIASDLPVFRELAGDLPTYLDPDDIEGWADALARFANPKGNCAIAPKLDIPAWDEHFRKVEELIDRLEDKSEARRPR